MRAKTDSYIVELRLQAGPKEIRELDHRFFLGFKVYNCMVTEARKRLNAFYRDRDVKEIRKRMRKKGYELTEDEKKVLSAAENAYGLNEFAFHTYLKLQGQKYSRYLDSDTIQTIGTRVWTAASSVLFGKGKEIHYQRYNDFTSLEGKRNTQGMMFRGGLEWNGLSIPVRMRKRDIFAQEAVLTSRIKYCRVVRRKHGSGFRYSLQLVLEGMPPAKRNWRTGEFRHQPSQAAPDVVAGYDPGTSTLAVVSSAGIVWQEYGDDVEKEQKTIRRLQRKLDRQRRANNPERFTDDGQYIRYKRGQERPPWHESRHMRVTRTKLAKAWRRRAANLKRSQYVTANQIIYKVGRHIVVEDTNFSSMAKRSKKTKINPKTGRPFSKKRFGGSILAHAPAQQIRLLTQKAKQAGGEVIKANPRAAKGSQYNHLTDTYEKVGLDTRWKELIPGIWVQRDLYSGFLYSCYNIETGCFDRNKCNSHFPQFYANQLVVLRQLKQDLDNGKRFPSCMGLEDIPQPLLAAIARNINN